MDTIGDQNPGPFPWGDNQGITKMGLGNLKIYFFRIAGQQKLKFRWKFSDIVDIQVC